MRVGVCLPPYRRWIGRSEVGAMARHAEDVALGTLYVMDHVVAPLGDATSTRVDPGRGSWLGYDDYWGERMSAVEYYGGDNWYLDAYTLWGFLAGVTDMIELSSAVVVLPYRDPVIQAKMMGTLDVLSGGRMSFGFGVGHVASESEALGLPFSERGRRADEYLDVIKLLLTRGEAEFEGRFVGFGPVRTLIEPVQKPHPPLLIGGNSRAAARRAVEHGNEWLPSLLGVDDLARGIRHVAEVADDREVSPPGVGVTVSWRLVVPGEDARAGRRDVVDVADAAARLAEYAELGLSRIAVDIPSPNLDAVLRQFDRLADAAREAGIVGATSG